MADSNEFTEALELLRWVGNPKKWELLGGWYYRCRGKLEKKWPHQIIQEAITKLESYKAKIDSESEAMKRLKILNEQRATHSTSLRAG